MHAYIHAYINTPPPLTYTYIYFPTHRVSDIVGHGPERRQGGGDAGADSSQPVEAEVEAGRDLIWWLGWGGGEMDGDVICIYLHL